MEPFLDLWSMLPLTLGKTTKARSPPPWKLGQEAVKQALGEFGNRAREVHLNYLRLWGMAWR